MEVVPITFRAAKEFIAEHHRSSANGKQLLIILSKYAIVAYYIPIVKTNRGY